MVVCCLSCVVGRLLCVVCRLVDVGLCLLVCVLCVVVVVRCLFPCVVRLRCVLCVCSFVWFVACRLFVGVCSLWCCL